MYPSWLQLTPGHTLVWKEIKLFFYGLTPFKVFEMQIRNIKK